MRHAEGLAADNIHPCEYINNSKGKKVPNIGLCFLKEAYYWSIMLVSRPFPTENASRQPAQVTALADADGHLVPRSQTGNILPHACVDSVIRTVDLLRALETAEDVPKMLPFAVNPLFVAALVLGLAQFEDLDQSFPLESGLMRAENLLTTLARRDLAIVRNYAQHVACVLKKRTQRSMERRSLLGGGLLGLSMKSRSRRRPGDKTTPSQATQNGPQVSNFGLIPITDRDEASGMDYSNAVNSVASESQAYMGFQTASMNLLPDLASTADMDIPISPRTLIFDSFDNRSPLFSAVDTNALQFGLADDSNSIFRNLVGRRTAWSGRR